MGLTLENAAGVYIIIWVVACNWVFLLPTKLKRALRVGLWLLTLTLMIIAAYFLDRYYLMTPHQAWQESTVYVVFVFMSLLFSTIGFLFIKQRV